jgi:transcriptional regulator with XRE-family HTH domain
MTEERLRESSRRPSGLPAKRALGRYWPPREDQEKRKAIENITEKIVIDADEVAINLCYLPSASEIMTGNQRNLIPALPFCHSQIRLPKPKPTAYPLRINTLGDHIRSRRLNLKLFQKQVADQIGVDATTITNWEGNTTSPAIRHIPAILEFLGYDPIPTAQGFPERLAAARKRLGLSQRKLAEKLGVDPTTVRDWEAGRHRPTKRNTGAVKRILAI